MKSTSLHPIRWIAGLLFAASCLAPFAAAQETELKDETGKTIVKYVIEVPQGIAPAGTTDPAKQVGLILCSQEHDTPTGNDIFPVRQALLRLGIRDNQPLLRALTRDADMLVRASALEGLLRLGDTSAIVLAADLATHTNPSIRAAAAHTLAATSDKQAVEILQTLLHDQQPQPRLSAVKALGKVSALVMPLLKQGLQDTDVTIRMAAAGSLLQQLRRPTAASKVR